MARLPGAGEPQHQRTGALRLSIRTQQQLWGQKGANQLMSITATTTVSPSTPEIPVR